MLRIASAARRGMGPALLSLAGVCVALLCFEAVLRLFSEGHRVDHNWRYHSELGWTQVPDARYELTLNDLSFEVVFNSRGFRDDEVDLTAAPGTRRVVVLGDSFSEAIQVPLEMTWHDRLEGELERLTGDDWEVINLGVGDYGTGQQLLMLDRALAYRPEVIVHQIFPLNDVCNNNVALVGLCKSLNDPYRPYFRLVGEELVRVDHQPRRKWLRDHFLTWFVAERRLRSLQARSIDPSFWRARFEAAGYGESDPLLLTYVPDIATTFPEIEAGWKLTEALVQGIVHDAREAGVAYVGLVIPFEARVGRNWAPFAKGVRDSRLQLDPDYPEERLARVYDGLAAPYVMLRPTLAERYDEVMPYWGGHLSPGGHAAAAEVLAPVVRVAAEERRLNPRDG